ncbi:E3 ubiquitin-protein ligase MARCH11 [Aspergillus udagawae]|uniref:E3 ubiquitin-protein ligase MARCH11 n=2 Tax=Aspergillus udagawae TaxID=91492 RepID=A0A8E0R2W3_9EURO|nr:uncharacterized protein Aud_010059 [Aspergillus udagawae]GFF51050.1 E3 ubiquitin-protein ligase MARCH11 [Aspergillus udagawae]GIC93571.1 hypothetical protein Aud_010059 [Aspergillus udagawae]
MNVHSEPLWQWPSSVPSNTSMNSESSQTPQNTYQSSDENAASECPEPPKKHYPNRTCRICLESVPPTFHPPSENLPGFLQPKPRVVYESSDPELGRLLRPCKCKGSSRYVHEGCLQSWRHADPDYGKRHYWQCPTCGFQYRLERLKWAHWISSAATQIVLTLSILLFTVFLLGFIADPIINLYVDPVETIVYKEYWEPSTVSGALPNESRPSWAEHFVKGLASLGLLSFIKAILALSPWQWWNLRSSGVVSSGRTTGRSRAASISWIVILIGVGTFLWAVWKGVRTWSRKTLEKAGERVMDVPLPDDDDEDEPFTSAEGRQSSKKDD